MEQLEIDNISLSDFRIKEILLGENYDEINIISEGSIRISDLMKFKETHIKIKNWKNLNVSKYVTKEPFSQGEHFEIDWNKNLETFDYIQEILVKKEKTLILNGFSKQSDAWLTYKFIDFQCTIRV